jgi:hypothetical protein
MPLRLQSQAVVPVNLHCDFASQEPTLFTIHTSHVYGKHTLILAGIVIILK